MSCRTWKRGPARAGPAARRTKRVVWRPRKRCPKAWKTPWVVFTTIEVEELLFYQISMIYFLNDTVPIMTLKLFGLKSFWIPYSSKYIFCAFTWFFFSRNHPLLAWFCKILASFYSTIAWVLCCCYSSCQKGVQSDDDVLWPQLWGLDRRSLL